jgi:two-component system phosphate regulon sensor histidine kinase PhoR
MYKMRWLATLMAITILGILGFQVYWLQQNYSREKKTLGIKTDVSFRETILRLQAAKLNLEGFDPNTPGEGRLKVYMSDGENTRMKVIPREEIVSTINVIRDKARDTTTIPVKKGMMITMNNRGGGIRHDSMQFETRLSGPRRTNIFDLLYNVDSLQDSLKVVEITDAYKKSLDKQNISIPFTVIRLDSVSNEAPAFNEVMVGFKKPVIYKLQLGNTFPYLIKQLGAAILFSILLMGITILSFTVLYRNLLRQQRLAELKNEFISNITHELKTPIATVGVAIEALKNFNAIQDPKRTREYLDISSNELQRLSLLVDKVLKLSMFEKKEIDLKYEPVDMKEVVDEVTGSMRLQLEKHQAQVTVTQQGHPQLQGDKLHLQSVVFNLLDNAIKYSREQASIQIDLREQPETVTLEITDNGIGIPDEYKDKIFAKFFRVPHGDTHNAKGYGLGLSYVAHVVQKHGGTIQLDSKPGTGAKFIITLPKTPPASKG